MVGGLEEHLRGEAGDGSRAVKGSEHDLVREYLDLAFFLGLAHGAGILLDLALFALEIQHGPQQRVLVPCPARLTPRVDAPPDLGDNEALQLPDCRADPESLW
jgi:hypothetical protein